MVKLTPELIELSAQYVNPVRDRELNLRGYKIPVIENLGATLDQFDTIDLSDNDIRKIDGFPLLRRLKTLLISNNRICLLRNPVATKKYYRLYLIHKLPQLRLIDFRKVKQKERDEASTLFKGKRGKKLEKEIGRRSKTFVPGGALGNSEKKTGGPSASDIEAIKTAIAKATTLEEVERLNQMLKSGQLPGKELLKMNQTSGGRKNETDDEDETMDTESGAVNGN
ncbi:U2 small nuclear ribonucleoprotein A'-like isoform X2 [Tachypleus tridentatus]|uniref:U2 small nuclear ribonucleoprotein A'-like isoform X2 n=1 Tax=Tachypleus tridentatus TaxID=6853 RepID=UPI003FD57CFC